MNTLLRICGTLLVLSTFATQATSQTDLAGTQARAEEALISGNPEQTKALSLQIIAADPDSFSGLFLLALAQSDLGEHTQAATSAGQAYRAASTKPDKLQASRLAGFARLQAEQYTRAELWLRRAANHITTEQEAETVVRGFRRAREANRLSLRFGAWVAPSDNINNGAENEDYDLTIEVIGVTNFELPEDRLPLSGIEYAGEAQISYRLSQNANQITSIGGYFFGRAVTLSSSARDLLDSSINPEVQNISNSDFALALADVSLTHSRQLFSGLGPTSASIHFGKVWYGGDPLREYQNLTLSQGFPAGENASVTISGGAKNETSLDPSQVDVVAYDLSGTYATQLPNADGLQFSLAATHSDGGFENIYMEYRGSLNYAIAEPILNTNWSVSFELGYRSYETFFASTYGREDKTAAVGAAVVFNDVSYFGFSPSMSVSASRTKSDVEQFTSSQVEAQIGIESNF